MTEARDDGMTVLAHLIRHVYNREQLARQTGLSDQRIGDAVLYLFDHDAIMEPGNGYLRARQRRCSVCGEKPGEAVIFDPVTLAWTCEDCEARSVEEVSEIVRR